MATYAIIVGINYYNDPDNRLNGCINDMLDYEKLLLDSGVPTENIVRISDDPDRKDIYPSKANLLKQYEILHQKIKEGDKVFLTYSGHGTNTRQASKDEPDNQTEAIYTADGKLITDNEFYDKVLKVKKGVKVAVVMDCCHSASILDLKNGVGKNESNRPDNKNHGYVAMISGCQDDQTSADYLAEREIKYKDRATGQKRYRGALTAGIVETIKKEGLQSMLDTAFSGSITLMRNLRNRILKWLQKNGFDQVPNIAYEGYLPPVRREGILHAFHGKYPHRVTKARADRFVDGQEQLEQKRLQAGRRQRVG
ncbi:MAG: caspase family protein [Candidatus Berkiella sp.]